MNSPHRIRTIYVKELIDILRDRRTLIAMIVVPIVLYPLLMLGSIQAVSMQSEELQEEEFVILTSTEGQQKVIKRWIVDAPTIARQLWEHKVRAGEADPQEQLWEDAVPKAFRVKIHRGFEVEQIEQAIQSRQAQLGVVLRLDNPLNEMAKQWKVQLFFDPADIRSATAAGRFREILERQAEWIRLGRLAQFGVPPIVIDPLRWEDRTVTTPGSILGQILPLILVLMTITGAIYPAIDLTAGERERGTLETLMVCPVPVIQLIVGKFLVITTIAIMGAVLNLGSISATVYFGGFQAALAGSEDVSFPFAVFPIILLALIPFAIFFSAVLIAVCSYAHTFKEAQNYITPIILAALVPGGIAALPTSKLAGAMLVTPVANMVLLTRELLLGASTGRIVGGNVTWTALAWVLASTGLYAAAAVALAAKIFGTESVIFADTGSIRSAFARRLIRPSSRPSISMASLVVALLFPAWFYLQTGLQSTADGDMVALLRSIAIWMPVLFVGAPLLVLLYWKVNVAETWRLSGGRLRFYIAGSLIGVVAWVPLHELFLVQAALLPLPEELLAAETSFNAALESVSPWPAILMVAVIPGVCEELYFRGFLLSGLRSAARKWTAIVVSACVFGVFHFHFFKIPLTVVRGIVLGYVCWQSGSIWPAVLAHVTHNGFVVARTHMLDINGPLGIDPENPLAHLPVEVIIPAVALTALALALCRQPNTERRPASKT